MNKPRPQEGASRLAALNEGLKIAFEAMRTNAIRSVLTILGVAVGVSVVVALAAVITGIRTSVMEAFEASGPNNFMVTLRFYSGANFGCREWSASMVEQAGD